jgi:hypothetical protein
MMRPGPRQPASAEPQTATTAADGTTAKSAPSATPTTTPTTTSASARAGAGAGASAAERQHARGRRPLRFWLAAYIALNLLDLGTTLLVLHDGGHEQNPIPAAVLTHYGVPGLILWKLAFVALMTGILIYGWRHYDDATSHWLTLLELRIYCAILALLCVTNVYPYAAAALAPLTPH